MRPSWSTPGPAPSRGRCCTAGRSTARAVSQCWGGALGLGKGGVCPGVCLRRLSVCVMIVCLYHTPARQCLQSRHVSGPTSCTAPALCHLVLECWPTEGVPSLTERLWQGPRGHFSCLCLLSCSEGFLMTPSGNPSPGHTNAFCLHMGSQQWAASVRTFAACLSELIRSKELAKLSAPDPGDPSRLFPFINSGFSPPGPMLTIPSTSTSWHLWF